MHPALKVTAKLQDEVEEDEDAPSGRSRLVDGLAGENTRWGVGIQKLQQKGRAILGGALLAGAFASYTAAAFDGTFRLERWQHQKQRLPVGVPPFSALVDDDTMPETIISRAHKRIRRRPTMRERAEPRGQGVEPAGRRHQWHRR
jgi:hypothetical protein